MICPSIFSSSYKSSVDSLPSLSTTSERSKNSPPATASIKSSSSVRFHDYFPSPILSPQPRRASVPSLDDAISIGEAEQQNKIFSFWRPRVSGFAIPRNSRPSTPRNLQPSSEEISSRSCSCPASSCRYPHSEEDFQKGVWPSRYRLEGIFDEEDTFGWDEEFGRRNSARSEELRLLQLQIRVEEEEQERGREPELEEQQQQQLEAPSPPGTPRKWIRKKTACQNGGHHHGPFHRARRTLGLARSCSLSQVDSSSLGPRFDITTWNSQVEWDGIWYSGDVQPTVWTHSCERDVIESDPRESLQAAVEVSLRKSEDESRGRRLFRGRFTRSLTPATLDLRPKRSGNRDSLESALRSILNARKELEGLGRKRELSKRDSFFTKK